MLTILAAAALLQISVPDAAPAAAPADYSDEANWLCLPGRQGDACDADLSATIVQEDGTLTVESGRPAPEPAVDCFYVYPTISSDLTPNSDLEPGENERRVAAAQFARFGEVCRTYAPVYRQVTLAALRAMMTGQDMGADYALAYGDVAAAFTHYMAEENNGRPFVLIGHSQGTGMLVELVRNEIDGTPLQDQMLSAMLIGLNVEVPAGEAVGGSFQSVPLCESAEQTGCAISWVSFRETSPPPATSRFGRVETDGMEAACVDPAALLGQDSLDAYLRNGGSILSEEEPDPWIADGEVIETPYVKVPGLLTGTCTRDQNSQYLAVGINAGDGPRVDDIKGDVIFGGQVLADWGLHLIDINLAQGDLIELIRRQHESWVAQQE